MLVAREFEIQAGTAVSSIGISIEIKCWLSANQSYSGFAVLSNWILIFGNA